MGKHFKMSAQNENSKKNPVPKIERLRIRDKGDVGRDSINGVRASSDVVFTDTSFIQGAIRLAVTQYKKECAIDKGVDFIKELTKK